jgi:hypothetical protein
MHVLQTAVIAAALGGAVLATGPASAMPVGGLKAASDELATDAQKVVWICGWRGCWWRPVYVYPYYYPYYHPYWGYWGRRRPYWGWRRWWW